MYRRIGESEEKCSVFTSTTTTLLQDVDVGVGYLDIPFSFLVDSVLPPTSSSLFVLISYCVTFLINYNDGRASKMLIPVYICQDISESIEREYPLFANGNWRNLLIYEFCYPTRMLFENRDFVMSLKILPISGENYTISRFTLELIQRYDEIHKESAKRGTLVFRLIGMDILNSLFKHETVEFAIKIPELFTRGNSLRVRQIGLSMAVDGHKITHSLKASFTIAELKNRYENNDVRRDLSEYMNVSNFHEERTDEGRYNRCVISHMCSVKLYTEKTAMGMDPPPEYS